ncbi:MAG: RNA polymerase sigma factor, partial [Candidatus Obscuribacterales bacterium]|nr:RNA polymerase sigma factor [Candidatus Obscuribacterales bacterium]
SLVLLSAGRIRRVLTCAAAPRTPISRAAQGRILSREVTTMFYELDRLEDIYKAVKILAQQILPAQCDDLTQEVLIKMWSARKHLPRQFGGGYLRLVVRNAASDVIRKQKRLKEVGCFSINENGSLCLGNDPEKQFFVAETTQSYREQRDELNDADQALARLSAEQRKMIVLLAAGFTSKEIAEKAGIAESTVRTRIHYARKKLNTVIGE